MPDMQVFVAGVEITDRVKEGRSTHRLNKIWDGSFKMDIDQAVDGIGRRGMFVLDGVPDLHGFITMESADDGEDGDGTVEYTISDPREIWKYRPARNGPATSDPGNYSKPTFFAEIGEGPLIIQDMLTQSENDADPANGEGPTFIDLANSSFATGGVSMTDPGPTDYPMSIEEIVDLLTSTGEVDVILRPKDHPFYMATLEVYNGNYGTDLSGLVKMQYGTGSYNVARMRRTRDMANLANKIRYLLGPKLDDEHWRRSIEATNTDFDHFDVLMCIEASRVIYGVRAEVEIYDSFAVESSAVPLYWALWNAESALRCTPRVLVYATPVAGMTPEFDVGDLIGVEAGSLFMGGLSGKQRVYERAVTWDEDGVVQIEEIVSSPDS